MEKIISVFIMKMVQFQNQVRIYHWQTKSYARHMAFGKTYDALGDLIDSFVEIYIPENMENQKCKPL